MIGADLRGADLRESDFEDADLADANLSDADCNRAFFADTDLSNSKLNDAYFEEANLSGADLREADIRNANLWRAELIGATFREADLSDGILVETDLTDADFTKADLTAADLREAFIQDNGSVDLRNATATGIGIDYALLDDLVIDAGTTFGGRSRWEAVADENAAEEIPLPWQPGFLRCLGRPFTGNEKSSPDPVDFITRPDLLEKAQLQYRATQRILRENDYGELPEFDVREKHARRKQILAEWEPGEIYEAPWRWIKRTSRWLTLAGSRWTTLYGESPWRVIYTSLAVIAAGVVIYPYTGLDISSWFDRLYFSVATFTPLMQAKGFPAPETWASKAVAMTQALLGVALTALLVAVLDRRITR